MVGAADAEMRLDLFHQDAAENVGPDIVVGHADAGRFRAPREMIAIRLTRSLDRCEEVDAREAA